MGRYIWYSKEGPGRAAASPSPLLVVPNITAHPSTASVLTSYYLTWHGRQRRCQEDPVSLLSGRLEKTTRSSPHHVAQHRPTGSETTPPYAPQSSRFGSEPPSVEDDVDVWRYAILELHARNDDDAVYSLYTNCWFIWISRRLVGLVGLTLLVAVYYFGIFLSFTKLVSNYI